MTRVMNDLTTHKAKLQSENGMCMFSPDRLFPSNLSGVCQHFLGEMYCAMESALKVARLGLLNGAAALHLLTFLSSIFL